MLFNLAKACTRPQGTTYIINNKQIKNREGTVFMNKVDIRQKWHEYFKKLPNQEHPKKDRGKKWHIQI